MAKPRKQSLKIAADFDILIYQALKDLKPYLGQEEVAHLQRYVFHPSAFLKAVQELLGAADAYRDFLRYSALRQLEAFLVKNHDLPGESAPKRYNAALQKFYESERTCRATNARLKYASTHPSMMSESLSEVLRVAKGIIRDVLGPLERLQYQKILESCSFGPGVTFSSSGVDSKHLYNKVGGLQTITREALPHIKVFLNHSEHWKQALLENEVPLQVVRGNRITTVPKTAVIDRTIAVEPSLNVLLQKGVDEYLKRRLRHVGVSLTDQGRNHTPARIASMRGGAATIDLSSASDSITTELINWLFPKRWSILLDDLRSKEYTTDKGVSWTSYEKFSSMGNAFTFPIESLIFYAVSKACTIYSGGDLSVLRVYGDDIIIDTRAALLLVEALAFLGFSTNTEKSFFFGPFRETCGSDFLSGVDTRPIYLSRLPRNDIEAYSLFNRLLHSRVGFQMHNVCAYLYRLVKSPLIGPPDLPAGEKYHSWYAGKSTLIDSYFHAPAECGDRWKRFDTHLQRPVWKIKVVRLRPKLLDTSNWTLQLWYLTFLCGLDGHLKRNGTTVESVSLFRREISTKKFYRWEDPPWSPWLYDS